MRRNVAWVMAGVFAMWMPIVSAAAQSPSTPIAANDGDTANVVSQSGSGLPVLSGEPDGACFLLETPVEVGDTVVLPILVWCGAEQAVSGSVQVFDDGSTIVGPLVCGLDATESGSICSWNTYVRQDGGLLITATHVHLGTEGEWQFVEQPATGPRYLADWGS